VFNVLKLCIIIPSSHQYVVFKKVVFDLVFMQTPVFLVFLEFLLLNI